MEEEDGFSPDPELAAAMGFSGFGTQPNAKRRKHNHDDAVIATVSPDGGPGRIAGKGANALPLGQRRAPRTAVGKAPLAAAIEEKAENAAEALDGNSEIPAPPPRNGAHAHLAEKWDVDANGPRQFSPTDLSALRSGVPVGNTVAYYLPSFIEDPWAKLGGAA